ncbi:MAG: insulinase family protein [Deltaproteobacteria bacterium]|jgi:zinc protease|nr:insulinase family protein [Deltaproteobacteria bacterium]
MRKLHLATLAALFLALASPLIFPSAPASAAADSSFTLDNGLKVILSPQPGNPVFSARFSIRTGSRDETGAAEYGLAHLMEHMAFKGTSRRKVGELTQEIENNGGFTNALTSFEQTSYYVVMPSDKLEIAVDVLSDMVFHPTYDPDEYAREKQVVIEEIRRGEDTPSTELYRLLYADTFGPDHPYGHRVIGDAEAVEAVSRDTALAFHDKFYRPDNAVLFISGGFDPDEARALADKYLSSIERPAAPLVRNTVPPTPVTGLKVRVIKSPKVQMPKVVLGFPCPSASDSAAPEMELLSSVMSGGDSSRLVETVRDRLSLVTSIGAYPLTHLEGGVFIVSYDTDPEKVLPALEAVVAELNRFSSDPPSPDDLARARALAAKDFVDSQEAASSMTSFVSSFELSYGDYRLKDAFLTIWSRIVGPDLAREASRIFSAANMTVTVLLPQEAPDLDEAAVRAAVMKLAPAASAAAGTDPAPKFQPVTLKSGARLFVLEDPSIPLVEVKGALLGGRLAERPGKEGVAALAAAVWSRASGKLPAPEMSRAVEGLGAGIGGFSGRNTIGMDGSFLSSDWKAGLALYAQILTDPAFSQEDFDLKKEEHLALLKTIEEDLRTRVYRINNRALFRDHPYAVESFGTTESVTKLTREDAEAFYRELVRPESLVFAVAGNVTAQDAAAALDEALEPWKPAPAAAAAPSAPAPPPELAGPVTVTEPLDRLQTHIVISFLAPGMGDGGDQAALDVLDSLLSGMGGVLFTELRDKQSLAYTVISSYQPGLGTGSFSFYIACAPEKATDAVTGIMKIIREAASTAYPAEKVAFAREYFSGNNKIQHQTLSSRADESAFFELYSLGQDYNDRLLSSVAAVTPEDIRRVAEKYLNLDRAVLSVVGTQASIDASQAAFSQKP